MILKLIFVLFISSVVIASGSLCEDAGNVTAQDPKYVKFNLGFFYIHGLTNGESVVMYKTPEDDDHVEYTFINDDCLYEIRSYNILENGTLVDYVKVLKKKEEFSISKILKFVVDDKAVEIKYEINKRGFVLNNGKEGIAFEKIQQTNKEKYEDKCAVSEDFSEIKISDKEFFELNYLKNGRFFYQTHNGQFVNGQYAFKTSNGDYYAISYSIFNPLSDYYEENDDYEIQVQKYTVKNTEQFSAEVVALETDNYFSTKLCFKSTGISIAAPEPINKDILDPISAFGRFSVQEGKNKISLTSPRPINKDLSNRVVYDPIEVFFPFLGKEGKNRISTTTRRPINKDIIDPISAFGRFSGREGTTRIE